jgi:hypothetical protein
VRATVLGVGAVFLANLDASAFTLAVPLLHHAFPGSPVRRSLAPRSGSPLTAGGWCSRVSRA